MSTKRMRRSLVEPGNRSNDEHRSANRAARRVIRSKLSTWRFDDEVNTEDVDCFEYDVKAFRPKQVFGTYGKEFLDTLNPLLRFLYSRVGTSWATAYSKIAQENDSRNLQGYHLRTHLHQYVMTEAEVATGRYSYRSNLFYVDRGNILRSWSRKR